MARKGLYLGGSALLLAVVLLLVFWGRPADAEIQVLKAPRAVVWKDFLGVNAQFLWFSPERYNKQIDRLQDLGLEWVRLDLHWDRLETAEDQYQLASLDQLVKDLEARQLKSVFYLVGSARFITTAPFYSPFQDQYPPRDPEVFARRMAMLSQRYPSVAAWQVWNEPNLIGFWRPKADPEGYAKLLQASTIALRMVDPEKPVVSAGMAFFSEMPDGRTMFDALGHLGVESLGTIATYHPYTQLPEGNYSWNLDFVSHANQINRALRNAGVPAIWSTEWGWSAYKGPKELQDIIGVEGQADYVLRRLALMSALDYDRIFLFTLSDLDQRASVRDRDYGLLDLDANPKPVYLALQRFLKVTGPKLRPADPPVTENLPDGSFSIGWTREDGRNVWLFWSARGGNVRLPKLKEATLHDPLSGKVTPLSGSDGLEVPVKSSLQMLVWGEATHAYSLDPALLALAHHQRRQDPPVPPAAQPRGTRPPDHRAAAQQAAGERRGPPGPGALPRTPGRAAAPTAAQPLHAARRAVRALPAAGQRQRPVGGAATHRHGVAARALGRGPGRAQL